ncbi:hypothetical protein, partial [Paraburkholderia tropica]|uniref:hypothetical protein n=1 Tax=Paraburkholderia tropica TaxID=92647 RepID=UPI002AB610DE
YVGGNSNSESLRDCDSGFARFSTSKLSGFFQTIVFKRFFIILNKKICAAKSLRLTVINSAL